MIGKGRRNEITSGKDTSEREGAADADRGRRKIIGEVVEDHTILIFKLSLARRLAERIMTDGLMTSVYDWYADLERIMKITEEVHKVMVEDKKWLLRVRDELDRRLAGPDGS